MIVYFLKQDNLKEFPLQTTFIEAEEDGKEW